MIHKFSFLFVPYSPLKIPFTHLHRIELIPSLQMTLTAAFHEYVTHYPWDFVAGSQKQLGGAVGTRLWVSCVFCVLVWSFLFAKDCSEWYRVVWWWLEVSTRIASLSLSLWLVFYFAGRTFYRSGCVASFFASNFETRVPFWERQLCQENQCKNRKEVPLQHISIQKTVQRSSAQPTHRKWIWKNTKSTAIQTSVPEVTSTTTTQEKGKSLQLRTQNDDLKEEGNTLSLEELKDGDGSEDKETEQPNELTNGKIDTSKTNKQSTQWKKSTYWIFNKLHDLHLQPYQPNKPHQKRER